MNAPELSTPEAIRGLLLRHIAAELRRPAEGIDVHTPFPELGLSSLDAAAFSGELSAALGRPLSPLVLWDQPTIDALARYLADSR